jgi:hypothetical protein
MLSMMAVMLVVGVIWMRRIIKIDV